MATISCHGAKRVRLECLYDLYVPSLDASAGSEYVWDGLYDLYVPSLVKSTSGVVCMTYMCFRWKRVRLR